MAKTTVTRSSNEIPLCQRWNFLIHFCISCPQSSKMWIGIAKPWSFWNTKITWTFSSSGGLTTQQHILPSKQQLGSSLKEDPVLKGIKTLFGVTKCHPTGSHMTPKSIFGGGNWSWQRQNILYLIMVHQYMGNVFNFTSLLTVKKPKQTNKWKTQNKPKKILVASTQNKMCNFFPS